MPSVGEVSCLFIIYRFVAFFFLNVALARNLNRNLAFSQPILTITVFCEKGSVPIVNAHKVFAKLDAVPTFPGSSLGMNLQIVGLSQITSWSKS